jgi:PAS domain S-box-containing protein
MLVLYSHTLLFTCPDCTLPIAISLICNTQTHRVECRYCKTESELPGVTAEAHWVNEWIPDGQRPSDKWTPTNTGVCYFNERGDEMTTHGYPIKEDLIRFQARVLESVNVAVIATTLSGEIVYWNRFATELYGWEADEAIGKNIMHVVVPTNVMQSATDIMAVLSVGETWEGEFEVKRKDGTRFVALVVDSPIFDDAGKLIGIVGVSHPLSKGRLEMERDFLLRTAELQTANDKLHQLSARLLRLRDDEGRRIARELHDSVGQLIAATALNIQSLKTQSHKLDEAGVKAIAETEAIVAQLGQEVRSISYLMHPPKLDELGLASALQIYIEGYSLRSKVKVKLTIPPDFGRLAEDLETVCFRIVQECLTNVHVHSKSTTAAVIVRHEDGRVLVEVRDNGKGIPPERLSELNSGSSGVGLAGMRERVKELNGTLRIKSDGNGTSVTATLPLRSSTATA